VDTVLSRDEAKLSFIERWLCGFGAATGGVHELKVGVALEAGPWKLGVVVDVSRAHELLDF